jgi:hypothetical protein
VKQPKKSESEGDVAIASTSTTPPLQLPMPVPSTAPMQSSTSSDSEATTEMKELVATIGKEKQTGQYLPLDGLREKIATILGINAETNRNSLNFLIAFIECAPRNGRTKDDLEQLLFSVYMFSLIGTALTEPNPNLALDCKLAEDVSSLLGVKRIGSIALTYDSFRELSIFVLNIVVPKVIPDSDKIALNPSKISAIVDQCLQGSKFLRPAIDEMVHDAVSRTAVVVARPTP